MLKLIIHIWYDYMAWRKGWIKIGKAYWTADDPYNTQLLTDYDTHGLYKFGGSMNKALKELKKHRQLRPPLTVKYQNNLLDEIERCDVCGKIHHGDY